MAGPNIIAEHGPTDADVALMIGPTDAKERASQRPRAISPPDPPREALAIGGGYRIVRLLRAISKRGPLARPDIIAEYGPIDAEVALMIAPTFVN